MDWLYHQEGVDQEETLPWLNLRPQRLTAQEAHFTGDIDLHGHTIDNCGLRLDDLSNVRTAGVGDGDILHYVAHANRWEVRNAPVPDAGQGQVTTSIETMDDVAITLPKVDKQVLMFDEPSSKWVNGTVVGGGGGTLSALTDVQITEPSSGQVLKFDGLHWANGTDETGGTTAVVTKWKYLGPSDSIAESVAAGGFYAVDDGAIKLQFSIADTDLNIWTNTFEHLGLNCQIQIRSLTTGLFNRYPVTAVATHADSFSFTYDYVNASTPVTFVLEDTYQVDFVFAKPQYPVSTTVTLTGDGTTGAPLRANQYLWSFGGWYNTDIPAYSPGEFWLDTTNQHFLLHKMDADGYNHAALMASLEYCSQLLVVVRAGIRNRYSISSILQNTADYVEYKYQDDTKLTVVEDQFGLLVAGRQYEIQVIQQPVYNLDHLLDVVISNPTEGQLLEYDSLLGWQNATVPRVLPLCSLLFIGSADISLAVMDTLYTIDLTGRTFKQNNSDLSMSVFSCATDTCQIVYSPAIAPMSFKVDYALDASIVDNTKAFVLQMEFDEAVVSTATLYFTGTTVQHFCGTETIAYPNGTLTNKTLVFKVKCTDATDTMTIKKFCVSVLADRPI